MRKRWVKRILIAVIILGAIALCQDNEPSIQQALYCEMVALHYATDGKHGYPDYKQTYEEGCDE